MGKINIHFSLGMFEGDMELQPEQESNVCYFFFFIKFSRIRLVFDS